MRIETSDGLIRCLTDPDEAVSTDWTSWRDQVDVVKVIDPGRSCWPALHRAGFRMHPAWITWLAPVGASEGDFLARVSRKERTTIRAAQRGVAERGIEFRVTSPVSAAAFDAFLSLYEDHTDTMEHASPFARLERDGILAQANDYFTVEAWAPEGLVGCCLSRIDRDFSTVVIRFASFARDARRRSVVRPMYMAVFETIRRLGFGMVSIGSDPALYCHIGQPELFTFKSGLRFTPVPSRRLGWTDDPDEATLVLRLDGLADPSLLVSYLFAPGAPYGEVPPTVDPPLQLDAFTSGHLDLSRYRAPFLASLTMRRIPPDEAFATDYPAYHSLGHRLIVT
jgi:hypothetical protein